MNLVNCFKTSHLIITSYLHTSQDSTWIWSIVLKTFRLIIRSNQSSSFVSSSYVNLVNYFKISHLIILSLRLHRSPGSTWTWLIVWIALIWFKLSHSFLHLSPACTSTRSIVWIALIWLSHIFLFIFLQSVRELVQLFEWLSWVSSDYHIPFSSSFSSLYVNLVNCLNNSHPIFHTFLFIHLQKVSRLGQGQLFEYFSSHLIIPSFLSVSSLYWTWSIVWIAFIWSFHHINFLIRL